MNESLKAFFEKYVHDEELQKKLASMKDPEEIYAYVHSIQDGFTKEEFLEAIVNIYDTIDQDINAADLAQAAGGIGLTSASILSQITIHETFGPVSVPIVSIPCLSISPVK